MRYRAALTAVLCMAALTACATAYQPYSVWNDGGYSEHEVQANRFQVKFVGSEQQTQEETEDFAKLRAADLCLARQKPFMLLGDFKSEWIEAGHIRSRVEQVAGPDQGYGTGRAEGETRYRTVPGKKLFTPQTSLTATCVDAATSDTVDAQGFAADARSRYRISN